MFNLIPREKEYALKLSIKNGSKFLKDLISPKSSTVKQTDVKTVYRSDGITVDKTIEYDVITGNTIRIINYDYFNDKKIKSVFDYEDGVKIRVTTFSFFKSVTDFDKKTGKKIRTTNYNIKDYNKKMSVYDYDIEKEKIIRMTVYRVDGKNVAFVKEISPDTGIVTRCINYKKDSSAISSVSKFEMLGDTTVKTTYYYSTPIYMTTPDSIDKKIIADTLNKKVLDTFKSKNIGNLIDNLYKHRQNLSVIQLS